MAGFRFRDDDAVLVVHGAAEDAGGGWSAGAGVSGQRGRWLGARGCSVAGALGNRHLELGSDWLSRSVVS